MDLTSTEPYICPLSQIEGPPYHGKLETCVRVPGVTTCVKFLGSFIEKLSSKSGDFRSKNLSTMLNSVVKSESVEKSFQ